MSINRLEVNELDQAIKEEFQEEPCTLMTKDEWLKQFEDALYLETWLQQEKANLMHEGLTRGMNYEGIPISPSQLASLMEAYKKAVLLGADLI